MVTVNPRIFSEEREGRCPAYAARYSESVEVWSMIQENPSATSFGRAQLLRLFGNAPLPRLSRIRQRPTLSIFKCLLAADPGSIDIPQRRIHILHAAEVSQECGASAIVSEMWTQASGSFHHHFRFWITSALRPV
jgi:hypothetical protein